MSVSLSLAAALEKKKSNWFTAPLLKGRGGGGGWGGEGWELRGQNRVKQLQLLRSWGHLFALLSLRELQPVGTLWASEQRETSF